jgi:hypothetical protein
LEQTEPMVIENCESILPMLKLGQGKKYFGIKAKPGVTRWNIASLFIMMFFLIGIAETYVSL